ncbi:hypothetical protein EWM64_g5040 [Hericium alpestre]|uniref:Peptidase S53 domain-containing protein n=1 Tax=Hericium alpestre TaxID=135208 RepID=A0A4Y9ZZU4_9AGAM|nr:hypothetical protein EWM64_g5040 [Hericium alpestre]
MQDMDNICLRHSSCNLTVTPTCVQDIYGLPSKLASGKTTGIAVSGFNNEFANEADLQLFLQEYRPDLNSSTTFRFKSVDGGTNSQNESLAGSEADLDTQWTVGLASGVPVTFYSVGDVNGQSGLDVHIDLANTLLSEDDPPQVLTTSYSFDEPTISPSMTMTLCRDGGVVGGVGLYNASGRAFPDVSAQGADMVSIYQGNERPGGGTSFAAPVIASTIALLNDELSAAGKAPLGFLDPLIYSSPDAFRDVTRGSYLLLMSQPFV